MLLFPLTRSVSAQHFFQPFARTFVWIGGWVRDAWWALNTSSTILLILVLLLFLLFTELIATIDGQHLPVSWQKKKQFQEQGTALRWCTPARLF